MKPLYKCNESLIEYDPINFLGNLEWFNIARCARERMADATQRGDLTMWQGHRKTFYVALNKMVLSNKLYTV